MEHFGGLQFVETGDRYEPSGKPRDDLYLGWPNPLRDPGRDRGGGQDQQAAARHVDVPARPESTASRSKAGSAAASRAPSSISGAARLACLGRLPSAGFQAYYPAVKTRLSARPLPQADFPSRCSRQCADDPGLIALAPAWGYLETAIALARQGPGARRLASRTSPHLRDGGRRANMQKSAARLLRSPAMPTSRSRGLPRQASASALQQSRSLLDRAMAWQALAFPATAAELRLDERRLALAGC